MTDVHEKIERHKIVWENFIRYSKEIKQKVQHATLPHQQVECKIEGTSNVQRRQWFVHRFWCHQSLCHSSLRDNQLVSCSTCIWIPYLAFHVQGQCKIFSAGFMLRGLMLKLALFLMQCMIDVFIYKILCRPCYSHYILCSFVYLFSTMTCQK